MLLHLLSVNRKIFAALLLAIPALNLVPLAVLADQRVPERVLAFPEADGFGKYTRGGRNGKVYVVNTLEDSTQDPAPGSLRYAIEAKGPRIIVFAVSGVIHLQKELVVRNDFLTLAGQSSPGGIVLRGAPFIVNANEVIVRYMRFRPGLVKENIDAASAREQSQIIFDHCSFSWSIDEVASFYNNKYFSLQYSIVAQSLNRATHEKGDHGYGGIWGGAGASFHHNVLAHNNGRNPRIAGHRLRASYPRENELTDIRNNVVYNWKSSSAYGSENGSFNFINNTYIKGPASRAKYMFRFYLSSIEEEYGYGYFEGNRFIDKGTEKQKGLYAIAKKDGKPTPDLESRFLKSPLNPQDFPAIDKDYIYEINASAQQSYERLINKKEVGANRNAKGLFMDSVDTHILLDIRDRKTRFGTAGIVDSEFQVIGNWKSYASEFIQDTFEDKDQDGMPDSWEEKHKLQNPGSHDLDKQYANIEVYLNSLGAF